MNELTKKSKVLRCLDCDALIINANGEETDACYKVNYDESLSGLICKNCGSLAGAINSKKEVVSAEDINTIEYMIIAKIIEDELDAKNINLNEMIQKYKAGKETQKIVKLEDIFKPIQLEKTPEDISIKSLIDTKYILLSKRHDSWKIFDSEKELLSELSKMPYNTDMLIYELGEEKKIKYNVSFA